MEHRFELFADYFQFYLQADGDARKGDFAEAWTDEAVVRMLALGPPVIGAGRLLPQTARQGRPGDSRMPWPDVLRMRINLRGEWR